MCTTTTAIQSPQTETARGPRMTHAHTFSATIGICGGTIISYYSSSLGKVQRVCVCVCHNHTSRVPGGLLYQHHRIWRGQWRWVGAEAKGFKLVSEKMWRTY